MSPVKVKAPRAKECDRNYRRAGLQRQTQALEEGGVERRDFATWAMAHIQDREEAGTIVTRRRLGKIFVNGSGRGRAIVEMMKYYLRKGDFE